jgi:hypothetical protein
MSMGNWLQIRRPLKVLGIVCLLTCSCTATGSAPVAPAAALPISPSPTGPIEQCGFAVTLEVPGTSNIFGAGIAELPAPAGGGGGSDPPCISIPRGTSIIRLDAAGTLHFEALRFEGPPHRCAQGPEVTSPKWRPDGPSVGGCTSNPGGTSISAAGAISGISSTHGLGYLVGVFLPNEIPRSPPPEDLDFGYDYDFTTLSPSLRQTFFIGDGRTTEGLPQRLRVPRKATRLYLGFADAWSFRHEPGFYDDNSGSLDVTVRLH